MKKTIIVWSWGQDGTILTKFLKEKEYQVLWIDKNPDSIDILDIEQVKRVIQEVSPNEIYYLAAYHHSSQEKIEENTLLFEKSYEIHVKWYLNFLEAIRKYNPTSKIFYASSSLIFGDTTTQIQDETTLPSPNSFYGITKLDGMYLGKIYRDQYDIFASTWILYNHESEYRSSKFVFMKIVQGALDIKNWKSDKLILGNLSAEVDRGSAYDYVEAMRKILQIEKADDFIISSGEIHTVQELVEIVFEYLEMDRQKYVIEEGDIIQRKMGKLYGNHQKLTKKLWWRPKLSFKEMITTITQQLQ